MGKFFAFIFGLNRKENEEHNNMEYYYDDIGGYTDNRMVYREHDVEYSNEYFDGGNAKREEDYKLNKSTDIF